MASLEFQNHEIASAIYQLFSKRILIKGSKLTKDSILHNNTRRRIFEHVTKNPGSHLRMIQRDLKLSPHQLTWHLTLLEKFGYLRKTGFKNKIAYFNFRISPKFDATILTLKDAHALRILESILLEPGINVNDIAKKVKLKAQLVNDIIMDLQELGLIAQPSNGDPVKNHGILENIVPILKILQFSESKIKKYVELGNNFQKKIEFNYAIEKLKT